MGREGPPDILLSELERTSDGNHDGRGKPEIYGFCSTFRASSSQARHFDLYRNRADIGGRDACREASFINFTMEPYPEPLACLPNRLTLLNKRWKNFMRL